VSTASSTALRGSLSRPPVLVRPRRVMLGGVCAGLAGHLGWRVGVVRVLMVVASLFAGAGILFYLWIWALTPLQGGTADEAGTVRRRVPVAGILLALAVVAAVCAVFIAYVGLQVAGWITLTTALAATTVVWSIGFDRRDPGRSKRYNAGVRTTTGIVLLGAGGAIVIRAISPLTAVGGVVMVVLGVLVLIIPRIVQLWTDLMAQRATTVREEQRAEIAAHLHDSVLQTLALIQNRAGASSEVARLARAQERELRDWLFAADTPTERDLGTELREIAASLELDFAVRFDVVTAGESAGLVDSAIVSAAREAMLNAARHAGGDVSVYLENSPSSVDVYVLDRGPGFRLDEVEPGRLGVRESIIGRMSRAGGSAAVGPGTGGTGIEVHLHLDTRPQETGDD